MNNDMFVNQMHSQSDLIDYITCNKNWPICFFDFPFQNKLPSHFVFKVKEYPGYIHQNYFYGEEEPN